MSDTEEVLPEIERVAALVYRDGSRPDAMPYPQLPEHIKGQIRAQVTAVYNAIEEVWSYDDDIVAEDEDDEEEKPVETEQEKADKDDRC